MPVTDHCLVFSVGQVVAQAAHLRAFAAVGGASVVGETHLAVAAVAHAQCTVYEDFKWYVHGVGHSLDFVESEFAGEHDLRKTGLLQESGAFGSAGVALCGCMERYRG